MSKSNNNNKAKEPPSITMDLVPPHNNELQQSFRGSNISRRSSAVSRMENAPKYRLFTEKSYDRLARKHIEYKRRKRDRAKNLAKEAKLVDGKIVFEEDEFLEQDMMCCDEELIEGNELPEYRFPDFPPSFMGRPVEEIDKTIKDNSFVVINSRTKKNFIYRFSANNAWFCMGPLNPIRKFFIRILTNQFFDYMIMLTILTNCVFLTLPNEYKAAEYTFLGIYSMECVIRLLARGVILDNYTYLRDPWNLLDITVVILSYVMIIVDSVGASSTVNISALRTFRVFRVLKTISIFPGLKTIISALLKSFRMLLEVIILIFFVMSVFALFALQVYMGVYRNKCVKKIDWSGYNMSHESNLTSFNAYYDSWIKNADNWLAEEGKYYTCGNNSGAGSCFNINENYTCLPNIGDNPNWGYSNFDNFGWSLLSTFQLITMDYWENQYNYVMRSSGSWNIIFFIAVVFIGAFYLMNLMLAVVTMSYDEQATQDESDKEKQEEFEQKERDYDEQLKKDQEAELVEDSGFGKKCDQAKDNEDDHTHAEKEDENKKKIMVVIDHDGNELVDRNCSCCHRCCLNFVCWLKFQKLLYILVTDPFFDMFIIICILINTIILACEHYPSSDSFKQVLEYSNYFFTTVFTLEALLKIPAMSKEYFKVGWNVFDLIVVIASLIDLAVEDIDSLTIFRTFRLFRVFKLAQSWSTMRLLLVIIFSTITALGNLTFILVIVIFIFAVIGLQLFRGSYTADVFGTGEDDIPRWNFEDFGHAMMMVFRVLCGEWIEPVWDCMRVKGELCLAVFIPTLVLGNFVVLNLFLALLLNSFGSDSLKESENDEQEASKLQQAVDRIKRWCCCCLSKKKEKEEDDTDNQMREGDIILDIGADYGSARWRVASDTDRNTGVTEPLLSPPNHNDKKKNQSSNISVISEHPSAEDAAEAEYRKEIEAAMRTGGEEKKTQLVLADCFCNVCSRHCVPEGCCECCACMPTTPIGSCWTNFRFFILRCTEHKIFETIILLVIFASSVSLCFEDIYLDQYPRTVFALSILNYVYAVLFTIEMLMKMVAHGFKKYFTSFWTILDFCIVVVSWLSIVADLLGLSEISAFRSLRTLRALRPLRAVSRWEGMRIVVNALVSSIPSIGNVLLVCMVFWLIFSITGVQFFKGKFYSCVDSGGTRIQRNIVPNMTECLRQNKTWKNAASTFDNVVAGYISLYQVATFEGWMEVMQSAIDSPSKIGQQPHRENSFAYYIFFVIFIIVGAFFTLNLFIGVIIDNFNELKKKYEGNLLDAFLTDSQKNYYHAMKQLSKRKPQKTVRRPKNAFQDFFFNVAVSDKFEMAIVVMIFINMVAMMVEHYKQKPAITQCLEVVNILFTTIFTFEAIIKIIGLRLHYFRIPWNVFDFVIVILSIVGAILSDLVANVFVTPTLLRVVRIFRIGRVLRLIKAAKGIRKLLFALVISLPALFNIGALLLLVVFIYAIVGMSVFGNVKHNGALNDMINFETFERSMVLLFRLTSSAGWNDVFYSLLLTEPDCNSTHITRNGVTKASTNGDCSLPTVATIYMISYIFVAFMVVINMYVAIILENFNMAHEQEEIGLTDDDFDEFYVVWERYDPYATQYIKFDCLSDFVAELDPPLGIQKPNIVTLVTFDLPIMEGETIHCLDVLSALVKHVLDDVEETEHFKIVTELMQQKFAQSFPTRVEIPQISTTLRRKEEAIAARILQRTYRMIKAQRAFPKTFMAKAKQLMLSKSNVSLDETTSQGFALDVNDVDVVVKTSATPVNTAPVPRRERPPSASRQESRNSEDAKKRSSVASSANSKRPMSFGSLGSLAISRNSKKPSNDDVFHDSRPPAGSPSPLPVSSTVTSPLPEEKGTVFSRALDSLLRPLSALFGNNDPIPRTDSYPADRNGSMSSFDEVSLNNIETFSSNSGQKNSTRV